MTRAYSAVVACLCLCAAACSQRDEHIATDAGAVPDKVHECTQASECQFGDCNVSTCEENACVLTPVKNGASCAREGDAGICHDGLCEARCDAPADCVVYPCQGATCDANRCQWFIADEGKPCALNGDPAGGVCRSGGCSAP